MLRASTTVEQATNAIIQYERPAGYNANQQNFQNAHGYSNRLNYARQAFGQTPNAQSSYSSPGSQDTVIPLILRNPKVQQSVRDVYASLRQSDGSPLQVNSGYRSREDNRRAGGAEHSQHIGGNAADLETASMSSKERNSLLAQLIDNPQVGGIGLYASGRIHYDTRQRQNGKQTYWSAVRDGSDPREITNLVAMDPAARRQLYSNQPIPRNEPQNRQSQAQYYETKPVPSNRWTEAQQIAVRNNMPAPTERVLTPVQTPSKSKQYMQPKQDYNPPGNTQPQQNNNQQVEQSRREMISKMLNTDDGEESLIENASANIQASVAEALNSSSYANTMPNFFNTNFGPTEGEIGV
jgi:hypothetical protein